MLDADGNPHGGTDFAVMPQGAGGFNICGAQSSDGATFANGVDVFGLYIRQAGEPFVLMTCEAGMPNFLTTDAPPISSSTYDFPGCKGVAFAPSDPTRLYFWQYNAVWKVTNANAAQPTAALTGLTDKTVLTNSGNNRGWNPIIAVHPTSANTVIAGTMNNGVYYTTNGGTAWSTVTIGANATYGGLPTFYLVAFDPNNGNNVYIQRQGTGLYRSTTGVGGSFSLMSGSPTYAWTLFVDVDSTVWVCDPTHVGGSALHKYVSGSWSAVTMDINPANPKMVAVNPLNTDEIVTCDEYINDFQVSRDGGATFGYYQYGFPFPTGIAITETVPWQVGETIQISQLWFDPIVDGKLWCSHGAGLAYSYPPDDGTPWQWHGESLGEECQVANNTLSIPGKPMLFFNWDTAIWRAVPSLTSIAKEPINAAGGPGIANAWCGDYAIDDNDYIVVNGNNGFGDLSGYSEDGGATWTQLFPDGYPSGAGGFGGAVAVSNRANQIHIPGNNQAAIYTKDEWATWDYVDPQATGSPVANWVSANYIRRDCVTADKERAGVFALVMSFEQGTGAQGLWVTTDGGDTWTKKKAGPLDATGDTLDFGSCRLAYIPGKSGELLYGDKGATPSHLLHYTNDGASGPTALGGITYLDWWNFGAAFPGQGYPAVYFQGTVGGVFGVYRSHDFFATAPTLLAVRPGGTFDGVSMVAGDTDVVGRCLVGHSGSGWLCGEYRDWATAT